MNKISYLDDCVVQKSMAFSAAYSCSQKAFDIINQKFPEVDPLNVKELIEKYDISGNAVDGSMINLQNIEQYMNHKKLGFQKAEIAAEEGVYWAVDTKNNHFFIIESNNNETIIHNYETNVIFINQTFFLQLLRKSRMFKIQNK